MAGEGIPVAILWSPCRPIMTFDPRHQVISSIELLMTGYFLFLVGHYYHYYK